MIEDIRQVLRNIRSIGREHGYRGLLMGTKGIELIEDEQDEEGRQFNRIETAAINRFDNTKCHQAVRSPETTVMIANDPEDYELSNKRTRFSSRQQGGNPILDSIYALKYIRFQTAYSLELSAANMRKKVINYLHIPSSDLLVK